MESIIPVKLRTALTNAEKALAALKEDFALVQKEAATVNDAAAANNGTAPLDTAIAALDEVDTAKCRVAACFALASLYYGLSSTLLEFGFSRSFSLSSFHSVNMKCGGLEPRTHDVMKELARVHLYIKKFQTRPHPTGLPSISFSETPHFSSVPLTTNNETEAITPGENGSTAPAAKTAPAASGKNGKGGKGGKRDKRGNRSHGKRH